MTDWNTAAAASMSQKIAAAAVDPVQCKRCGKYRLAWVKSGRTGKWYLAETISGGPGKVIAEARRPHKCQEG